ncbi:hypothetical protein ACKWTF_006688 [Chironomus riparius]
MEKLKSILSSSRKVGPPVPPRPPMSTVQKALEKSRNVPHNFPQPAVPIAKGRTVIYTSKINNNMNGQQHIDHQQKQPQQQQQHSSICENKCFDTKFNESSTGLKVIVTTTTIPAVVRQNGNTARVHESPIIAPAKMNNIGNDSINKEFHQHPITHHKSPMPRPRLKTPPLLPNRDHIVNIKHQNLSTTEHQQHQQNNNNYTRLLMQNQNTAPVKCELNIKQSGKIDQNNINNNDVASRDDELKEKLLNEIFSGRLVEASNVHIRYNGNGCNLKRSSSVDVLNDRNSIAEKLPHDEKLKDRKVMFHEMLISELSEMRRAGNDTNNHQHNHRLSLAKSCSDLSPSGNKQMTIMEMRDDVKINRNGNTTCLISLEDSGVEDEEKADDCSSSGVGDSWDSCKDMQNRINMSLPGLPPLPKSLSGIEISQQQNQLQRSQQRQVNLTTSDNRTSDSTLDTQLAILRREMYSLRQMDLSLLSQLWALNESIQEFRTIMQDQENYSQQSPSPSDLNSLASDDDEDNMISNDVVVNGNKITLIDIPKSDRTNVKRRMNISPPAPPLSSKC